MNKNLLTLLLTLTIFSFLAEAQSYNKRFGFEVNGGIREYHGDLGSALYLQRSPDYQTIGGSFGIYLNPSFDVNLYGSVGDLGFHKQTYDEVAADYYRQGFRARITDAMLGLTYKFNNGYILREDATIKPFLKGGWGVVQSVAKIEHNNVGYTKSRTWIASHWNVGAGLKIAVSDALDIVINEQLNYSFDDNYDGAPYVIAGARLNSAEEGNKPLHDIYMSHTIGFVFNFGANGNSGYKVNDEDGDGINDKFDLCPNTPEKYNVDTVGCPLDDDKDGVYNEDDKCPNTPGSVENKGCPEVSQATINEISLAAKGINFETDSDVIKAESNANLDKLAIILNKFEAANIMIEGHTDSQGDDEHNRELSQKRADAVMKYLSNKGVAKDRMTSLGFGETKPIGDNETAEGRAQNRRVDFKLVY